MILGEIMGINRIVFTGAPSSGKTQTIKALADYYKNKVDNVFVCEEAAAQLINEGKDYPDTLSFQLAVFQRQIENENKINEILKNLEKENTLVFYDRGVTDCFACLNNEQRKELTDKVGVSLYASFFRYDTALVFELCDEKSYVKTDVRKENFTEALSLQNNILSAYVGHPHLRYIKSFYSFEDKIKSAADEMDFILEGKEIEKKYLIEYPSKDILMSYKPFICDISQTYLLSSVGSHRVRQRSYMSESMYYETIKMRLSPSECFEEERLISKSEYDFLLKSADPNKNAIVKKRCCFLYEGKYFELDLFDFWSDKALLEVELKSLDEQVTLPDKIKIIKDVSDDEHYKNNYLAGMKL